MGQLLSRMVGNGRSRRQLGKHNRDDFEIGPLIPGLPDHLALETLVTLPRRFHSAMAAVSPSWRRMLEGDEFYNMRHMKGLSEQWLYIISQGQDRYELHAFDPAENTWHRLPSLQIFGGQPYVRIEVINRTLYAVQAYRRKSSGGNRSTTESVSPLELTRSKTLKFDFVKGYWEEVAPIPQPRTRFVSGVLGGKLYVVGGGSIDYWTGSTWVYTPEDDKWEEIAEVNVKNALATVTLDGRLYVLGGVTREWAAFYDPHLRVWTDATNLIGGLLSESRQELAHSMSVLFAQDFASMCNVLYAVEQFNPGTVYFYDKQASVWRIVKDQPPFSFMLVTNFRMLSVGKELYILGGVKKGDVAWDPAESMLAFNPHAPPGTCAWRQLPPAPLTGKFMIWDCAVAEA